MRRAWRNLVLGVFVLLILAIVFIGAGAIAYGAPITAQSSSDQIAAWASATLLVPVESRQVVVRELGYSARGDEIDGLYDPATDVVSLAPKSALDTNLGVYVRLHELLHKPDTAADCRREEEAIVDALARDLAPALVWRMLGQPLTGPIQTAYDIRGENGEPSVGDVLAASAVATGQSWRSREARLWRRALWAQNCDGRRAMLEEVAR